jgi:hypothetical protein
MTVNNKKSTLEKVEVEANRINQQKIRENLLKIDSMDYVSEFKKSFKKQWKKESNKQKKGKKNVK